MLRLVLSTIIVSRCLLDLSTREVDVHPALIVFGMILQPQFATHLLNARLDLLNVVGAVVTLPYDHMQMGLASLLRVADSLLDDGFCLFNVLAVQVDRVPGNFANGIVFSEDVFGRLLVDVVCFGLVFLGLRAHVVRRGAVSSLVRFSGFGGIVLVLALFFARKVAESVVLAFGVGGWAVVEGWVEWSAEVVGRGLFPHTTAAQTGLCAGHAAGEKRSGVE